jgi:hypothetical protein
MRNTGSCTGRRQPGGGDFSRKNRIYPLDFSIFLLYT